MLYQILPDWHWSERRASQPAHEAWRQWRSLFCPGIWTAECKMLWKIPSSSHVHLINYSRAAFACMGITHGCVEVCPIWCCLTLQQLVPAHLATSPIPTESHLFWISEVEQRTAKIEDDVADPDDPPEPLSTQATKKKKRRRKKHKGDPRREELTPPISVPPAGAAASTSSVTGQNEEIFEMDLSSDEEAATHVSRWICRSTVALEPP